MGWQDRTVRLIGEEAVEKIITAVKAKIAADGAKDVLGSLKKLF